MVCFCVFSYGYNYMELVRKAKDSGPQEYMELVVNYCYFVILKKVLNCSQLVEEMSVLFKVALCATH